MRHHEKHLPSVLVLVAKRDAAFYGGWMARLDVFPIINCRDILATRDFYLEVFDAKQVYQFPDDGDPVYLTLSVGAGSVALGVGTGPAMYGETPLPSTGHAVDVCLYVPDLAQTIRNAKGRGTRIPVAPADMPWGETVAYIQDPEGTMLLVIQASLDAA